MQELDDATFDAATATGPVVVDFWAPWCRPCKAIEPILDGLTDRVRVARLNVDEHPRIAARYEVLSIPTVILFETGGEPRGAVIGDPAARALRALASGSAPSRRARRARRAA